MRPLFSFLVFIISFGSFAQISPEEQVIANDAALNKLIVNHEANAADLFYADQFCLTTSSGKVKFKKDMLREIGDPKLLLEINVTENIEVAIEGSTAILRGRLHQKGSYQDKMFDHYLLVTDTWILTKDGWKILAGHATLLPKT